MTTRFDDRERQIFGARWRGLMAFKNGESRTANPHEAAGDDGVAVRTAWFVGWETGYAIREGRGYQELGS